MSFDYREEKPNIGGVVSFPLWCKSSIWCQLFHVLGDLQQLLHIIHQLS